MKAIQVILNPTAGRGYGAKIERVLYQYLEAQNLNFDLVRTNSQGHATELAQLAAKQGYDAVVAAGGDGTTNEVVNGLMKAAKGGETIPLGVIPIGSGSDFSYAVDVPADLEKGLQTFGERTDETRRPWSADTLGTESSLLR